ncbi:hypothetical protein [Methanohalobium sp.]|uniref:hypothetical protein n=1 Tax=Methanohalobium sp. TaxID=2837493 RepID=UPI0025FA181E|nr:hypothetical protein [Methanohalobium sp.]
MIKPKNLTSYSKKKTNNSIGLTKILLVLTFIVLFIPSVSAEVTNLHISPDNPNPGDEVNISGTATTDDVEATVEFTKSVNVSEGKYSYTINNVKIPEGDNTFKVIADGVKNLKVDANVWWAPTLSSDASDGTASVGTSMVPSGTYDITISGDAQDDTSSVDLTIVATRVLSTDSSGNFEFSYDTDPIPEGDFSLTVGSESRTINLAYTEYHPYDLDRDCMIDISEVNTAIDDYRTGQGPVISDVNNLVDLYRMQVDCCE